ncbi:MAG: DUF1559 domain-containing protein [Verrucomicrobia bacterium]|nr:DUF1559 domain-containing protein [Verrucomicrobiota bacterium]
MSPAQRLDSFSRITWNYCTLVPDVRFDQATHWRNQCICGCARLAAVSRSERAGRSHCGRSGRTASNAKNRAQRVSCTNNLRQLGIGLALYADDQADKLPPTLFNPEKDPGSGPFQGYFLFYGPAGRPAGTKVPLKRNGRSSRRNRRNWLLTARLLPI